MERERKVLWLPTAPEIPTCSNYESKMERESRTTFLSLSLSLSLYSGCKVVVVVDSCCSVWVVNSTSREKRDRCYPEKTCHHSSRPPFSLPLSPTPTLHGSK